MPTDEWDAIPTRISFTQIPRHDEFWPSLDGDSVHAFNRMIRFSLRGHLMNHDPASRLMAWAAGKPPVLVGLAMQVVSAADELHWTLRFVRGEERCDRLPPPPPVKNILKMYRRHRRMFNFIGAQSGLPENGEGSASDWSDGFRAWDRLSAEEKIESLRSVPKEVAADLHASFQSELKSGIEEIVAISKGEEAFPSEAEMSRFMSNPIIYYLLWVWFPCWLEYREFPPRLLRHARNGDLNALEKLLRIDKSVLHDPGVAYQFLEASRTHGSKRLERLAKSVGGAPLGNLTKAKLKKGLAALISRHAQMMNYPLTEPEIRQLFDIMAGLRGALRDRELPSRSDTLSRTILRERDGWYPNRGKIPGQKS